jgi:hypothetical protein
MPIESSQNRTLNIALRNCGGGAGHAKALKIPLESLSPWLTGREAPSAEVYMATLKIVASGRAKPR